MKMTSSRAALLAAVLVLAGLSGCSKHDANYYKSHPEERQDMLEDCHGDAGRGEAECNSADAARQSQRSQPAPSSKQPPTDPAS